MVTRRPGRGKIGCLLVLAVLGAAFYFGSDVAEMYFRFYRFRDAVEQETQYGTTRTDDEIKRHLAAVVDSLGIPEEATRRLEIRRSANRLVIETAYTEHVDIPFYKRDIRFAPSAESRF